jgi:uncharacterized cupredoxin-like copper-binding protein
MPVRIGIFRLNPTTKEPWNMSGKRRRSFDAGVLTRRLLLGFALLALVTLGFGRAAGVSAQEASPVASPVAGPCDAPSLPPGTPTPLESPVASPEAVDEAAVEAEAAGTPEAAPVGTPADDATTSAAQAAAVNIANCINGGNYEGAVALMTSTFTQSLFGTGNPYDVLAGGFLDGTTFAQFTTGNVSTFEDGRVSVEVTYFQSEYQFVHEAWTLKQDGEYWKIDALKTLLPEPEGDTAVVGITLGSPDNEYVITPNVESVNQAPVLSFSVFNAGKEAHELVVLKLPAGVTADQLLQDESLFNQVEFIGAVSDIAPGDTVGMALVNLPAGEYTLICFFPSPDGVPHAALGMVTTFTVNAPA